MQVRNLTSRLGFVISLFCFFLFVTNASGTTYYVDPDGSNSNPGTVSRPWAHPQRCADKMVGGDTCIVKDGIYSDNDSDTYIVETPRNGFPGADKNNWVTFKAENTHGAVLDGQNKDATGRGFMIQTTSFVNIIGFEIKRVYTGIRMSHDAHDIYIADCEVHDIGRHWTDKDLNNTAVRSYAGINSRADTWNITVENCYLHDIGRSHNLPEGSWWRDFLWDHGIYANGTNFVIRNCKIERIYSGWHIKVDGHDRAIGDSEPTHIISNCKLYGNNGASKYKPEVFWGQILLESSHGAYKPHNVIIENCEFNEPEADIAIRVNDGNDLKGTVFRNNRTSGRAMYNGGRGMPTLVNNALSVEPIASYASSSNAPFIPTNLRIISNQ